MRWSASPRVNVADSSLRPANLSTAASRSRFLLVNSCAPLVLPPVVTTAIRSFAPRYRSMNWRAAVFTRGDRWKLVCKSSSTSTYTRPSKGRSLLSTSGSIG